MLNPLKLLIIDDEEAILTLLSTILLKKGYCIDTANNGEDGIKKIETNEYSIIITDMKMPGITGKDILFKAKKIKGHGIPVIGMSGTPWLLNESLFDAVLTKPFLQNELFELIEKIASSLPGRYSE
ncbi:MAG: response regulator [Desulfobacula sp.]|nr:response regulator [Desulfobacula sp.]